ncbi:hypothetical protein [Chlamydia sp. 04-14]
MSKRGASTVLENMVERVDDFCASLGCFSKRIQIIGAEKRGLVFKSSCECFVIDPEESDLNLIIRTLTIILIIPMIILLFIKLVLRFALFCKYGFTTVERIEIKVPQQPKTPTPLSPSIPRITAKPQTPRPTPPIKPRPMLDVEIERKYLTLQLKESERELMQEVLSLLLYGCEANILDQMGIITYGDIGIHRRFSFRINKGDLKDILFTYIPGQYVPPGGAIGVPIWLGVFRSVDYATFKFYAEKCLDTTMANIELISMRQRGVKTIQEKIEQLSVLELSKDQFEQLRRDCCFYPERLPICSLEEVPCYHNGELVGHAGVIAQDLPKEEG